MGSNSKGSTKGKICKPEHRGSGREGVGESAVGTSRAAVGPGPLDYPEPDPALLDQWREGKRPSNAHTRAYLAGSARTARAYIFRAAAGAAAADIRRQGLEMLRQHHRQTMAEFIDLEHRYFADLEGLIASLEAMPRKGGGQ